MNKEIEIPEGYEARIEGNKVILEPKESEDERMLDIITEALATNAAQEVIEKYGINAIDCVEWLEKKKGNQTTTETMVLGGMNNAAKQDKALSEWSKDEKIREIITDSIFYLYGAGAEYKDVLNYLDKLEKQKEQKEINLVKILKHYPKETELYSPLYGKLWLAEVDETNEIITCYKHPLEKDDVRATLEQEDTVSFYSNGTTGLPDFEVSKDCMLFFYNNEKAEEQKPAGWSEEKKKLEGIPSIRKGL